MARNGYFQLVNTRTGYGIKCVPPEEGGEAIRINEVMDYLGARNLVYDLSMLKNAVTAETVQIMPLAPGPCPAERESYQLKISEDQMTVTARFYPPSGTGKRISMEDFIRDLRGNKIVYGLQMGVLQNHFQDGEYCKDLVVAVGRETRHGRDGQVRYFFNTDLRAAPTLKEDGSVDFFHLNTINHCKKGEMLAQLIPEDPGEPGMNVFGVQLKPRAVKRAVLKFGHHIALSEDHMSISSEVDGHVMLVEGKVFVSDVYEVENVDNSTGNIDFEGSVQVNGNVCSGFAVSARGNVIVKGVVEGATVYAGGDIVISRGMNGMGKGHLEAGGNIIAKFLENATANAVGYVSSESILHSKVMAGTEITVSGKRGFITGGHVCAGNKVVVKNLGANLGAATIVEVGVNPRVKEEQQKLQKEILEIQKVIRSVQPILASFAEKKAKGAAFSQEQIKYLKSLMKLEESKKAEMDEKNTKWEALQSYFEEQNNAYVEIRGEVYPGTTIVIRDVSKAIQSNYKYCRFERVQGDVKMVGL